MFMSTCYSSLLTNPPLPFIHLVEKGAIFQRKGATSHDWVGLNILNRNSK